jgi:stage II sporulation protein P
MSNEGIDFKKINKNMPNRKMNFSKHAIKKNSNAKIMLCTFTLLAIFLLGLILPKSAKADNEGNHLNYFYINVINNVLSIINVSNTEEQDTNSENNMKVAALSFLGIDIMNPISIVTKEIAYLDKNEDITDVSVDNASNGVEKIKEFILNPFNLDDKQVSKSGDKIESPNVIAELYNPKLKQTLNNAKPRVLIYHSHTTEAYLTTDKDIPKSTFNMDLTKTVCAVGDVLAQELEKNYGIAVIHDKTLHNVGDYMASYKKSGATLDKYLKTYGDFDLIIDLHRDGVPVTYKNVKTKINGEEVAKFAFVVTQGNPRYSKQKKLVNSMIETSKKLFPGLLSSREIWPYNRGMGFYNQNKSDNAVLFEVGNNNNTIEQAKNTGKYLSRIIAEQLNSKK